MGRRARPRGRALLRAVLLVFAILTRGAEGRIHDLGRRRRRIRELERALNPTGTLALAAVLLLALGAVFDTVLR